MRKLLAAVSILGPVLAAILIVAAPVAWAAQPVSSTGAVPALPSLMSPQPSLLDQVVSLVLALLAPVLASLLAAVMAQLFRKFGIQVEAEQRAKLEHLIAALVAETEEWASARLKAGIGTTAADKAQYYLQRAMDTIPGISQSEAHALAQTTLGRLRLGTTAVLQDVQQAATTGEK